MSNGFPPDVEGLGHRASQEPPNRLSSGPERAQETVRKPDARQVRAGRMGTSGCQRDCRGGHDALGHPPHDPAGRGPPGAEKKGRAGKHVVGGSAGGSGAAAALLPEAAGWAAATQPPTPGPRPDPRRRLAAPGIADRLVQGIKFLIIQLQAD